MSGKSIIDLSTQDFAPVQDLQTLWVGAKLPCIPHKACLNKFPERSNWPRPGRCAALQLNFSHFTLCTFDHLEMIFCLQVQHVCQCAHNFSHPELFPCSEQVTKLVKLGSYFPSKCTTPLSTLFHVSQTGTTETFFFLSLQRCLAFP